MFEMIQPYRHFYGNTSSHHTFSYFFSGQTVVYLSIVEKGYNQIRRCSFMKKLITFMTMALIVFALAACTSDKDDSDAVVETKSGNITKDEFYNKLKDEAGEDILQQMVLVKVLEGTYEANDNEIDKRIDSLKDQIGEQFDMWLQQQGLEDEDELREQIYPAILQEKA